MVNAGTTLTGWRNIPPVDVEEGEVEDSPRSVSPRSPGEFPPGANPPGRPGQNPPGLLEGGSRIDDPWLAVLIGFLFAQEAVEDAFTPREE